jgi:E3 ubiquitin-protein ligase HUWE1
MRYAKFQEKLTWFRLRLETNRISWEAGSDVLRVDRSNIMHSSLQGLRNINLHKELKIQFTDEKVDDAGGLLR